MKLRQLEFGYDVNRHDFLSRYDASTTNTRIIKLEKQMNDALASQDCVPYYRAVNSLNVQPIDRGLYERGAAEAGVRDGSFSERYPNAPQLSKGARQALGNHFNTGFRHSLN
jgi:hypothetical protein